MLARVKHLPPQVRFIVTSRDENEVFADFLDDLQSVPLSESSHKSDNDEDIAEFVRRQIREVSGLQKKAEPLKGQELEQLVSTIVLHAEGNFLYVAFLLNSLAMPHHPLSDLDRMPSGLEGLYHDSIRRVVDLRSRSWQANYSPLMGVLSVAQSPLTSAQIEQFTGQAASEVWSGLIDLQQFISKNDTSSDSSNPTLAYRLYHQSVIDFLHTPHLWINTYLVSNIYWLHSLDWHLRIVNHYLNGQPDWTQWDNYGLRYLATHVAEAVSLSNSSQQHQYVERLAEIVCSHDFRRLHKQRINDLALLQRDLERTLKATAANSNSRELATLLRVAMVITTFRRKELRPDPLFELAAAGDIAGAKSRLDLFDTDADWKLVALLLIAWLAAEKKPEEARHLLDQVKDSSTYTQSMGLLISRLDAEFDNTPLNLHGLPVPPTEEVARELVSNPGGKADDIELLMHHCGPMSPAVPFADGPDTTPGYFAEGDAPLLVAYAEVNKPDGDKYFRQYIAVHTSYNYVQYRNRSLLHILEAALRSPDREWVQEMAVSLTVAALAGNALEFQEGVPLTVLGIRGISDSSVLDAQRVDLIKQSDELRYQRDQGDSWGLFRRRLGSLAQVYAVLLNNSSAAVGLLELALSLPYGFAGFNAPASLYLAEATQVSQPGNLGLIRQFLEAALNSAHNIQDLTFCARSTARVNAMRERWWRPGSLNLDHLISQLVADPSAAEFAALHRIGEDYDKRDLSSQTAQMPEHFRQARSLRQVSLVHQRPLGDFLRINREKEWDPDELLPPGTEVNVPDPGFATQLAARFSAETLRDPTLTPQQRISLIQQLVPLASLSPTTLDTVFARLILATQPHDKDSLAAIEKLAIDSLREGQSATAPNTRPYGIPA